MDESLLLIQKIKIYYQTKLFSNSDNRIAEYIMAKPQSLKDATAYSLAKDTGTSPATVVRFCRKLGYSGFSDMKSDVSNYIIQNAQDMSLKRGDDVGTVKSKVISYTKMVLDQLNNSIDNDALSAAAQYIIDSDNVIIVSEGGSGTMGRAAYDIFRKLAVNCRYIEDPIFQTMEIGMMGENDLLIIILNSGRTINTIENAKYAKDRGIKVIGLVGTSNTPLSPYLDVEITTSIFSSDYFSDQCAARMCELITISILHSVLALQMSEPQLSKGHEITKAIDRKRIIP